MAGSIVPSSFALDQLRIPELTDWLTVPNPGVLLLCEREQSDPPRTVRDRPGTVSWQLD